MLELSFILISYISGAIPFSVWLGRALMRTDIRQYGDGNPGATNVFRAGNNYVGLAALILDITKAAMPVGVAYNILGIRGLPMFLIGLAPVLGHIYSPFLGFKGGKALAASFGAWIGLAVWRISTPAAIAAIIGIIFFTSAGWAVILALAFMLVVILIWYPDPLLLSTWVVQAALLIWTHRANLKKEPQLRPWVKELWKK